MSTSARNPNLVLFLSWHHFWPIFGSFLKFSKNQKIFKIIYKCTYQMRLDERIPNLVLFLQFDKFLTPFLGFKRKNMKNLCIIVVLACNYSIIFYQMLFKIDLIDAPLQEDPNSCLIFHFYWFWVHIWKFWKFWKKEISPKLFLNRPIRCVLTRGFQIRSYFGY